MLSSECETRGDQHRSRRSCGAVWGGARVLRVAALDRTSRGRTYWLRADRLCPPPQADAFNLAGASHIISEQETSVSDRRELYQSSEGHTWFLGRDPSSGGAVVIREPNRPSGAHTSCIGVGDFLRRGDGPEQQALLRLIATLVDVPPYSART